MTVKTKTKRSDIPVLIGTRSAKAKQNAFRCQKVWHLQEGSQRSDTTYNHRSCHFAMLHCFHLSYAPHRTGLVHITRRQKWIARKNEYIFKSCTGLYLKRRHCPINCRSTTLTPRIGYRSESTYHCLSNSFSSSSSLSSLSSHVSCQARVQREWITCKIEICLVGRN